MNVELHLRLDCWRCSTALLWGSACNLAWHRHAKQEQLTLAAGRAPRTGLAREISPWPTASWYGKRPSWTPRAT